MGLEVIPIFLFPLWKHYDLNYIRKMANFCTMVSDLPTNEQMSEQTKQSKQGSEWCLVELMTMQAEGSNEQIGGSFKQRRFQYLRS